GAVGIEEADFISMRAPKPTLILAATGDYFRIADTRTTFNEAKRVYQAMGFPERVDMFEYRDRHGFSRPRRQAAVRWMRRWLYDDNRPVVEPELKVQSEQDLWVTKNGQADSFWKNAVNVRDLNIQRAKELAAGRKGFWKGNSRAKCLQEVKRLIGYRELTQKPTVKRVSTIARNGYRIEKCIIERTGEVPLAALLFLPDEADKKLPATLYVDGRGKQKDAAENGPLAKLAKQGRIVLSVDLRGFGETAPRQSAKLTSEMLNDQYINGMLAMYIGRPLLGQRVGDVTACIDVLTTRRDVDATKIDLVGVDRAGPVALHAAVLDERFTNVTLRSTIRSWVDDVISKPLAPNVIGHVVPSVLTKYDLPDLATILGDRCVITNEP
ncbi:MAG: acetylxylan esterase, partial [Planctomycetes bacterium]|nr:acetylxylan esterase [Planctomycetota bacterium]